MPGRQRVAPRHPWVLASSPWLAARPQWSCPRWHSVPVTNQVLSEKGDFLLFWGFLLNIIVIKEPVSAERGFTDALSARQAGGSAQLASLYSQTKCCSF